MRHSWQELRGEWIDDWMLTRRWFVCDVLSEDLYGEVMARGGRVVLRPGAGLGGLRVRETATLVGGYHSAIFNSLATLAGELDPAPDLTEAARLAAE